MNQQTLANMKVVLAAGESEGRLEVPLDSFMKFDLQMSRDLQQLELRWKSYSLPARGPGPHPPHAKR